MLRSSILYASETYYDLKENELRAIERIEEGYMRKLVKTTAGCAPSFSCTWSYPKFLQDLQS